MNLFAMRSIKILLVLKAARTVKHASHSSSFVPNNFLGLQSFEVLLACRAMLELTLINMNCSSLQVGKDST